MLNDLVNDGAIPTLAASMRYSTQRQEILAHNIANIDTPGFIPRDVEPAAFESALSDAIDRRRSDGGKGGLRFSTTDDLRPDQRGGFRLTPQERTHGVLAHDENNRNIEESMLSLVENTTRFRFSVEMLRTRLSLLNTAIRERL